ncbi:S8 family peptidase [Nonomuraea soli]|uniref:Subtilisin family serine protease n=1 Tax=Nonomuraea soli TaxID=1032476 RepID=A0A7W0CD24_9ACTN|nr:S8 family serine peptidase [Nonomuraea soli]MBA2888930.1 subtilisin family serine protease [Nonomuraea soli]
MWRKKGAASLSLAVLAGLLAASPAHAEPGRSAPGDAAPEKSVTLITGDKVTLRGQALRFVPGSGRKTSYLRFGAGDELTVIPTDVADLVARGVLDERLFQVNRLVADGLDDASSPTLPLIVQYPATARAALPAGGTALPSINGVALAPAKDQPILQTLMSARSVSASKIWLDAPVKVALEQSVPQVGAPEAWQAGYTGQGVKVAVLDTGIDATHPDLAKQIEATQNFTYGGTVADGHGHGTHVASTIAGLGATHKGVAPGARLLIGKVLSDSGSGATSRIISGMEWAARSGAKIINMSLGGVDSPGEDPMEQAVARLTAETGALFVIAAGNDGDQSYTVGSPGSSDSALTVGAVDKQDVMARFSSRGPRAGDNALKPDLVAPGVDIVAARSSASSLPAVDGGYTSMSGTSMATPHVAGAAAVLAQRHPDWTWQQLKSALTGSAKAIDAPAFQQGSGRLDVARAVRQEVFATATTLSFGSVAHPYEGVVERTVTYTNAGSAPVTLQLSATAAAHTGEAAPAGMFAVPAEVTVPAGGSSEVKVTATPSLGVAGPYAGRITARSADGSVAVQTGLSLDKAVRTHKVKLTVLDREGTVPDPAARALPVYFESMSGAPRLMFPVANGSAEIELAEGRYLAIAAPLTIVPGQEMDNSLVVLPDVEVTGEREIVFDARTARTMDVKTDKPDSETSAEEMLFTRERPGGLAPILVGAASGEEGQRFSVTPTGEVDGFAFRLWSVIGRRGADGYFADSPYAYYLMFRTEGRVPESHTARDRDLAAVPVEFAAIRQKLLTPMVVFAGPPSSWGPLPSALEMHTTLPSKRTEYFTPGIGYTRGLNTFLTLEHEPERTFKAHRRYRAERWNQAVLAPALPDWGGLSRAGDKLTIGMPLAHTPTEGRTGFVMLSDTRTTLYAADGTQVAAADQVPMQLSPVTFTAPAGKYRVVMEGTADRYTSELSTPITSAWTFTSQQDGPAQVLAVVAAPELDLDNAAPAGPMTLPLRLESTSRALPAKVGAEVSYDDGATWHKLAVLPSGPQEYRAVMLNPSKPGGFASLRLTADDRRGNTVTTTVTRAFRLK